ncbi:MAG: HD domain-containing protein [Candidatus Baldrarchaeia archaeon]
MPKKQYWSFIKDPLYGYIHITDFERELIDTRVVQRLRRIKQLAGAEYVYPGANHTRFEHSIGVMYLAGVLAESLPVELSDDEICMVKIAGLLHDVGHGPFSHLFESISTKYLGKTHESFTQWLIRETEIADILSNGGFSPQEISDLAVGKYERKGKRFLGQIISSAIDVDKMDFVPRDSYHTGAGYGNVDVFRLIYTMDVLDNNLAVDMTAISALETFILARVESFRSIYFHKVARAAQIMIALAMERAKEDYPILVGFKSPDEFLELDDYSVWAMLKSSKKSEEILRKLERRDLLKVAYSKTFYVKDQFIQNLFINETIRRNLENEIAETAGVDYEDVIIDVPTVPSVPYGHSLGIEPMEIPVFSRGLGGEKIPEKLSEVSNVITALKGFMNIIRIYTWKDLREKVAAAAEKIFGDDQKTK